MRLRTWWSRDLWGSFGMNRRQIYGGANRRFPHQGWCTSGGLVMSLRRAAAVFAVLLIALTPRNERQRWGQHLHVTLVEGTPGFEHERGIYTLL